MLYNNSRSDDGWAIKAYSPARRRLGLGVARTMLTERKFNG
jgi:hypothetical protein